uniref:TF-B3 domain-containing protein n=1 Tax=Aegilops tauschii subsp. strangulata TaxID=200361 RepID=A0A453JTK0_AEGTS
MQTSEGLDLKLKAPSGETWHVGVSKVANELFLRSGWGGFAKAHELQENDLLLFTCTGNASFEVLIFDPSGCEKLSPLFAGRMRKHFDNMVGQGGVEQYPDSDDTRVPSQFVGSPQKASTSRKCSGKTKSSKELPESPSSTSCHVKLEATEEQKSDDDTCTEPGYYSSRTASQLNEDEKQEIMERASIRPGNPAFVVVLLMTHLQRKNNFLTIPSKFAADHLQSKPREVLLLRLSREDKWHVRCYYSSRTRCFNCQRWVKFVRDNGLRKEDDNDDRPCRQEEERWPVCHRGLIISSCPPFLLHFGMQYVVPTCHSKLNLLYLVMHLHENAMAHFLALLMIIMLTSTSLYG